VNRRLARLAALACFATGVASTHAGDPPDAASLEHGSRSMATVGAYRVYLHAADEQVSIEKDAWCFAGAGARSFRGTYRLVATKKGRTVSTLDVGTLHHAEGELHDGLRTINIAGHRVLGIAQYLSCTGDALRLYRLDGRGTLAPLRIGGPLGTEIQTLPTHYAPPLSEPRGPLVFCDWGGVGNPICASYRFDGERLVWADQWEPKFDDERSWRRPSPEGRAVATLGRFLGYLADKDERRAAALFDGTRDELRGFVASCPSGRLDAYYELGDPQLRGKRYRIMARQIDGDARLQFEVVSGSTPRVARPPNCHDVRDSP
jgi:hypothetical protein